MRHSFDISDTASPILQIRDTMPDPLDPDSLNDFPVVTTRRRLTRLALVAAETGARFQRDGIGHDPMAWLLAPRLLFDGLDAIEAAADLRHCTRAILLHGLGIGLDADPTVIDELCADDERSVDDDALATS